MKMPIFQVTDDGNSISKLLWTIDMILPGTVDNSTQYKIPFM